MKLSRWSLITIAYSAHTRCFDLSWIALYSQTHVSVGAYGPLFRGKSYARLNTRAISFERKRTRDAS